MGLIEAFRSSDVLRLDAPTPHTAAVRRRVKMRSFFVRVLDLEKCKVLFEDENEDDGRFASRGMSGNQDFPDSLVRK